MNRAQSLKAALSNAPGVTALAGARIYPLVALPTSNRLTVVFRFAADYDYTLNGIDKINAPLEVRQWGSDYDDVHALAAAVQAVLMPPGQAKGFNGFLGGTGGIHVIHCLIDREEENLAALGPGDDYVFEVVSHYDLKYIL